MEDETGLSQRPDAHISIARHTLKVRAGYWFIYAAVELIYVNFPQKFSGYFSTISF
jgi:hypothetical protein